MAIYFFDSRRLGIRWVTNRPYPRLDSNFGLARRRARNRLDVLLCRSISSEMGQGSKTE